MSHSAEMEGASIVLLGAINPAIFHPSWFHEQGLIAKPDLDSAEVELVTRQLSVMTIGGMRVIVQPEKFQVETSAVNMLGPLRDLVLGAFKVLEHSPVTAMGLNYNAHYKIASKDDWHSIGHRLAPKDIWEHLLDEPGTRSVIIQGKRPGSSAKYLQVQVEPSQKVKTAVYVGTNEHYANANLQELLETLASQWEASQQFARELSVKLLEHCLDAD